MNKKTYILLHAHSDASLLDGLCSPKKLIQRCVELGLPGMALTDHGSISAIKTFYDECEKAKIKCIIGCELYQTKLDASIKTVENNHRYHLIVLAKNDQGIKDLIALVSESNQPHHFYRKPRLSLEQIAPFAKGGNLIFLSACIGGQLPSSLFVDFKEACSISEHGGETNLEAVRKCLRPDWVEVGKSIIAKFVTVAGKGNFFIELQDEGMSVQTIVVECLRELGKQTGIPTVATADAHYCRKNDAEDQRLLLYAGTHTTKEAQDYKIATGQDVMDFFVSDEYYIFSYDEMREKFTEKELEMTLKIANTIEYSHVGRDPCLPVFTNDESKKLAMNSHDYLQFLCIRQAKIKLCDLPQDQKQIYWQRLKSELAIIQEAGLSDYFLIVWDACNFIDSKNGPRGKGRGSGAGSLINYLTGITGIDPIQYGLFFSRFYNSSRNIRPHFNVGQSDFMIWMTSNLETLSTRNIKDEKKYLAKYMAKRIKSNSGTCNEFSFTTMMQQEVAWIDKNNQRMWMYLYDMLKQKPSTNPCNSHLAYGLGMTLSGPDELDTNIPVKINDGHISLPDIDIDVGVEFRSKVITYLKKRWGEAHVSQMITFGRLQGKAALKEVFRANPDMIKHLMKVKCVKEGKEHNNINMAPYDLCNEITKYIPDEAAISDELQQIREESGEGYGILEWAIEHVEQVKDAYEWYKPLFDQAIRIEGTKKSQSKHAAGVVITSLPIKELVPLVYDAKNKDRIVGLDMSSAEAMGCVKFDFLAVTSLDKMWFAQELINQQVGGNVFPKEAINV